MEKKRSRIRSVQMDNLRGLLGIRRMDRFPNAWRRIGLLRESIWECADSCSVGNPWKRWIDTVKGCLRKRGLNVRQVRRMMQDRSKWQGFVRWNALGVARGMNP